MTTRGGARGRRPARAWRLPVLVAALVVALATGLLAGCTSPGHQATPSSSALTSAPGSGGAAPAVLGPSGSASSSPPVLHTDMREFVPLDAQGKLTTSAQQGGSGSCFATSIAVPLSGVFRCLSDNTILDPCFAPVHEGSPATVVCFADPWSGGTILTLTAPLPTYSPDLTEGNPWALELGNGARCVAVTGAIPVLGDVELTYRCEDGGVAGLTTTDDGTLVAHYGPSSGPLQDVGVLTAWRGRSYRFAD